MVNRDATIPFHLQNELNNAEQPTWIDVFHL